jgi:hypothetical protein
VKRKPYTPTPPIPQQAEPYNGINRKERRKLDATNRLAERAEFKRAEARYVDFGPADGTTVEAADVERPCVFAKAVHAAKMARRRERGKRKRHSTAAAREKRFAVRHGLATADADAGTLLHAAMVEENRLVREWVGEP